MSLLQPILGNDYKLTSRADLAYYIPFKLWSILNNKGKLGIIIPYTENFFGNFSNKLNPSESDVF